MISIFGSSLIFLAFIFSIIGLGLLFYNRFIMNKDYRIIQSAINSMIGSSILIIISFITLLSQIINNNFDIKFVAKISSSTTPLVYKIGSLWAGSQGSLLLWTAIISLFIIYFVFSKANKFTPIFPTALIIIGIIFSSFSGFLYFLENPFDPTHNILEGTGTTPSLQNLLMLIHPPLLYIGYIGFLIPFSITLASLIENSHESEYLKSNRKSTLFSWIILTIAIVLGGRWAYLELGWGGYWAWDPVENASLMPWLVSTAYLHSILVEQKKGMLRLWNVILISLTYWLTILGVCIVRSGIIQESVHTFAESPIGYWLLGLTIFVFISCLLVIVLNIKNIKPKEKIESFASRESGFLYNNVMFVGLMLFILFAILQPVFHKIIFQDSNVMVDMNGYNGIAVIFGIFLLALMGVGPFLAWKRTSKKVLKKIFFMPVIISFSVFITSYLLLGFLDNFGLTNLIASIYIMLIIFVAYGIFDEFIRATFLRVKNKNENYLTAFLNLLRINRPRYGGYIVHLGFLIMVFGMLGKAFDLKTSKTLNLKQKNDSILIGNYKISALDRHSIEKPEYLSNHDLVEYLNRLEEKSRFPYQELENKTKIIINSQRTNHFAQIVNLNIAENESNQIMTVEKRYYISPFDVTKEIALSSDLLKDIYVVLDRIDYNNNNISLTIWVNYLVNWFWIGTIIILIGGLISMNIFKSLKFKKSIK
tara:strand:- start:1652 stop:3766 length:2115 start_codon:yes stop_codon:yes gene_type:complete